jgi:hypothetical protein
MNEQFGTKRLLVLRKLTRAAADLLRGELREYLATLAPVLRQRAVLGEHVKSNLKETVKGADAALKELQSLHEALAPTSPFGLARELKPPLDVISTTLELTPTEYAHEAKNDRGAKKVTVSMPLKWVLHYAGCTPRRLKELLAERDRIGNELQQLVQHYLMLHVVLTRQPGVVKLLRDLRFEVGTGRLEGCGDLPITYITAAVATVRPPDEVIIENTEISGMDVFEEVLKTDDIVGLRDPVRERLLELAKGHGENLTAS